MVALHAALRPFGAPVAFMALLMERAADVDDIAHVFFLMACGTLLCRTKMMAVDAFGIVPLDVGLVVESYLLKAMARFFKEDNVGSAAIGRFHVAMALDAFSRSTLFVVAVFAEGM